MVWLLVPEPVLSKKFGSQLAKWVSFRPQEAAGLALRNMWCQDWQVHRRPKKNIVLICFYWICKRCSICKQMWSSIVDLSVCQVLWKYQHSPCLWKSSAVLYFIVLNSSVTGFYYSFKSSAWFLHLVVRKWSAIFPLFWFLIHCESLI